MSIVNPDTHDEFPCPDCEDGKVPMGKLLAALGPADRLIAGGYI